MKPEGAILLWKTLRVLGFPLWMLACLGRNPPAQFVKPLESWASLQRFTPERNHNWKLFWTLPQAEYAFPEIFSFNMPFAPECGRISDVPLLNAKAQR
jgi:hypothetical protein